MYFKARYPVEVRMRMKLRHFALENVFRSVSLVLTEAVAECAADVGLSPHPLAAEDVL